MEVQYKIDLKRLPQETLSYLNQLGFVPCIIDSQTRKKKRSAKGKINYQVAIRKLRKKVQPKLQLSTAALSELDKILEHVIYVFSRELIRLANVRRNRTLSVKQLECATKLCLPNSLNTNALKYARRAVSMATVKGT
ncbi:hypothetical protein TNCV_3817021 [Trichonephila clavipes]|nr:hypothetical protein TNCV_3817021 [Trichonephila clavipes]